MKKLILFATACVALVACSNNDDALNIVSEGTHFTKGQAVTIGVSAGVMGNNALVSRASGKDNGEDISFTWEKDDKILVTVKDTDWENSIPEAMYYETKDLTAEFTLATGARTSSATFTGEMPGEGKWFEIQYPVSTPDLASQTYEAGTITSGLMSFSAKNCKVDDDGKSNVTLTPESAILQLNLYGVARSVSTIKVTNQENSAVLATLNCADAVTVGKDKNNATPFYIVMNPGSAQLQIDVTTNEGEAAESDLPDYLTYGKGIPISCTTFMQSSSHTISAGQCLNMPAISLTTIWAPVNCGYDPINYKYGKLYQWGRKDGCGYVDYYSNEHGTTSPYDDAGGIIQNCPNPGYVTSQIDAENEDPSVFYNTTYIGSEGGIEVSLNTDWLATRDDYRWDGTGGSESVHFATKTKYDPCPEGWRVPTYTEMATLLGGNTSTGAFPVATHGSTANVHGRWFNGSAESTPTTGVFLPAAGYRNSLSSAACAYRDNVVGTYWTSSVSMTQACSMGFGYSAKPSASTNSNRSSGYSVRCVRE